MMSRTQAVKWPKPLKPPSGFTLLEVLVVVSIIAILGSLALPAYQRYVAKARSSELALMYDGVRTKVQVQTKAGTVTEQCSAVTNAANVANLQSEYAAMDVAFEAVQGGFTPVMRFCAFSGTQGVQGVDATREAHHLLSRSSTIGKGAVIGDAVVSFSVGLLEGAVACKVAPPAGKSASGCNVSTLAARTPGTPPTVAAVAISAQPQAALQPTQPNPQNPIPLSCPAGQEAVTVSTGQAFCAARCPAGQVRSASHPMACVAATQSTTPPVAVAQQPAVAATTVNPALPPNVLPGMQVEIDLLGSDILSIALPQALPQLCMDACAKDNRCKSWTYAKPGIAGPTAACFIKYAVPTGSVNTCCISGVKQ